MSDYCDPPRCPLVSRVESLEAWRENREEARVDDIKLFMDKIGEVHEKVNKVANMVSNLGGKFIAFGFLASAAGAAIMFLLTRRS